jgi:hypothetical protein
VHEAAPEAEYFPAAQSVAVSAARPAPSESSRAVPPAAYLPAAAAATVMAPSAAPSDEVMMYPGAVLHAVSVVVEVEASEVIPAALPESLNVVVHAVGVACALFVLPTVP